MTSNRLCAFLQSPLPVSGSSARGFQHDALLTDALELHRRVLSNGLQEPIAHRSIELRFCEYERLADQFRHAIQNFRFAEGWPSAHCRDSVKSPATRKHRKSPKQRPLVL